MYRKTAIYPHHDSWSPPPRQLDLDDSQVHVWKFSLNIPEKELEEYFEILDSSEQQRANRRIRPQDANHFIAAHGGTRFILAKYLNQSAKDISFKETEKGKPFLDTRNVQSRIQFNLTHSAEMALLAVSQFRPVGVDIEYLKRKSSTIDLAKRFFSEREFQWLKQLPEVELKLNFLQAWTRKEALLKATGKGLSGGLDRYTVACQNYQPGVKQRLKDDGLDKELYVSDLPRSTDYVAAVACIGDDNWQVRCWELKG